MLLQVTAHALPLRIPLDYTSGMTVRIDWSRRVDYMRKHGVDPGQATEAVNDELSVWLNPDPASKSGMSARVIGFSSSYGNVLVVILIRPDTDEERPDGDWWGGNAWRASATYRRMYEEGSRS